VISGDLVELSTYCIDLVGTRYKQVMRFLVNPAYSNHPCPCTPFWFSCRADNVTRSNELHSSFFQERARGTQMAKLTIGEACPRCKSIPDTRIRRSLWMRIIPLSRHYFCSFCNSNFVSVENTFSFSLPTASRHEQQPVNTPSRRTKIDRFKF